MKILRVVSDLYPSVVGGMAIHAHEMSKMQAELGHEVDVYTTSSVSENTLKPTNIYKIHGFEPLVTVLGNSISLSLIPALVRSRHEYDIIHSHAHLYFSTNLCAALRKISSSPLVITNHGLNSQTAPKWFQDMYNYTGTRFTYSAADKIICYTKAEKKELVNLGIKKDKISVIHNGINTDLFIPAVSTPPDKRHILWVGRYVQGKGVDYLIDAFYILKSKYPEVHLTMVGKGPDKNRIVERMDKLGLKESITLKDFIPNSKIVNLYQDSSIFVLPSLEEGVPRSILEAMSCGIPIVCTRLPQLVDVVKESGILVPARDVYSLVDAIATIMDDVELAKKYGANGRKNVVKNYSWVDTVKRTIQLYEELI